MTEQEEQEVILLCESKPYGSTSGRPRESVYGVAVNDAPFIISAFVNGRYQKHPAYSQWKSMIARCYSEKEKAKSVTYEECTLDPEWLSFMNFYGFWKNKYKYLYQVDKDILFVNNKLYSPTKCTMVPCWVNTIIGEKNKKSNLPIGVVWNKNRGKFIAQITTGRNYKGIGYYDDPVSANHAWFKEKIKYLNKMKSDLDNIDHRLFHSLFYKLECLRVKHDQ